MNYCCHCFLPEEECHDHKFIDFPAECVCDKGEWLAFAKPDLKVPAICYKYVPSNEGHDATCKNCEHDEDCHD